MTLRAYLRKPTAADWPELLSVNQASRTFHAPWVSPPLTEERFKTYLERCQNEDFEGLLICHKVHGSIVGVVNVSQIFYGPFQNAYLGYYGHAQFAGQGLMTEGLSLVLNYVFHTLKLHRVEANIQPGNVRSIQLVRRLGFSQEGFSRRYLQIDGEWRDHERWALTVEGWPENSYPNTL